MSSTRAARLFLTVVSLAACCLFLIGMAQTWSTARGILSPLGVPMGADLLQHHEAARMARAGLWHELYHDSHLGQSLHALTGGTSDHRVRGFNYVYPPLVAAAGIPFAGFPYLSWVACWQLVSVLFYVASLTWLRPFRPGGSTAILVALGLPVFAYGIILAQNSALSLLILSATALALGRGKPWLAGALLSCLFYKPQIGIAAAGFLFLAGQWRAALGFGFASLAWLALGWVVCGTEATLGWFDVLRQMLDGGQKQVAQLHQSLPGTLKTLAGPDAPAWLSAAITLAGMAAFGGLALISLWKQLHTREPVPAPVLLFLAFAAWTLFSPYVMHYDLLLASPLWAWQLRRDLDPETPRRIRHAGIAAGVAFWIGALVSINPGNLPVTPALPFLAGWLAWACHRSLAAPHRPVSAP